MPWMKVPLCPCILQGPKKHVALLLNQTVTVWNFILVSIDIVHQRFIVHLFWFNTLFPWGEDKIDHRSYVSYANTVFNFDDQSKVMSSYWFICFFPVQISEIYDLSYIHLYNHLLRVYYELKMWPEHCTGIAEVMGSNPVQAWTFFRFRSSKIWSLVYSFASLDVLRFFPLL